MEQKKEQFKVVIQDDERTIEKQTKCAVLVTDEGITAFAKCGLTDLMQLSENLSQAQEIIHDIIVTSLKNKASV